MLLSVVGGEAAGARSKISKGRRRQKQQAQVQQEEGTRRSSSSRRKRSSSMRRRRRKKSSRSNRMRYSHSFMTQIGKREIFMLISPLPDHIFQIRLHPKIAWNVSYLI